MELTVLGWSQPQIARDLGISQAAVSKILKRIETRQLREWAETLGRQRVKQTLRLEHVFAEAMGGWHESKADTTRRRQRQTLGGDGAEATVAELVVENQHGDPRYLDEARKALADQRKLWGLDAPQKVDLHATRDAYDDMSEEALRAELARQTQLLRAMPTVIGTATTDVMTTDDATTDGLAPSTPPVTEQESTDVHKP
jgi:transcriptional regulator with XRE-family HTH domain